MNNNSTGRSMNGLTHFSDTGRARMVDVSEKPQSHRTAIASGVLRMRLETLQRIKSGGVAKGDVLTVADVAAVMAAKRTGDAIPMCHGLMLSAVDIGFSDIMEPDAFDCVGIKVLVFASCIGQTGVEMESLYAASVALLTVYDMCKAMDRGMRIENIQLEEKHGGGSGTWTRGGSAMPPKDAA